jgi:hypothetical protein
LYVRAALKRDEHRLGSFPGCHDIHCCRIVKQCHDVAPIQRMRHEPPAIGGVERGTDNRRQILAKIGDRAR